jgi:hypothetical protein
VTFHIPEDFRKHLQQIHSKLFTVSQVEDAVNAVARTVFQPAREQKCPFCLTVPGDTKRTFASHVGKHMQDIALAALPLFADSDSDDASLRTDRSQESEDELPVNSVKGVFVVPFERNPKFIGQDTLMGQLSTKLEAINGHNRVALVGLGGIG